MHHIGKATRKFIIKFDDIRAPLFFYKIWEK